MDHYQQSKFNNNQKIQISYEKPIRNNQSSSNKDSKIQQIEEVTQPAVNPQDRKPKIIPNKTSQFANKKTLVLDLDETLIHSSSMYIPNADISHNININGQVLNIYVKKRPGVEEFIKHISDYFELIIFTASLQEYAESIIEQIDQDNKISIKIYRENCTLYNGAMVKDLSKLGDRELKDIIIVDNSPHTFQFQPSHAILIKNFYEDDNDTELLKLTPFLKFLSQVHNVSPIDKWQDKFDSKENFQFTNMQQLDQICNPQNYSTFEFENTTNNIGSSSSSENYIDMDEDYYQSYNIDYQDSVQKILESEGKLSLIKEDDEKCDIYQKINNSLKNQEIIMEKEPQYMQKSSFSTTVSKNQNLKNLQSQGIGERISNNYLDNSSQNCIINSQNIFQMNNKISVSNPNYNNEIKFKKMLKKKTNNVQYNIYLPDFETTLTTRHLSLIELQKKFNFFNNNNNIEKSQDVSYNIGINNNNGNDTINTSEARQTNQEEEQKIQNKSIDNSELITSQKQQEEY